MARYAIYSTNTGTSTARPVLGLLEIPDDPSDTFSARLAAQTALLNANEALIQILATAGLTDLDSDVNTQDFTVNPTLTPPVALAAVTVARYTLAQRQAFFRAKRDALIERALPYAQFGRQFPESLALDWLTYINSLRNLADEPADPEGVVFPTIPSTAESGGIAVWQRLYRRGNVLDPVSQVSGFPTGGLMEDGQNANGTYVKFADGTQMCWATISSVATANVATGNIFRSNEILWTFPVTFSDTNIACFVSALTTGAQWGKIRRVDTSTARYEVFASTTQSTAIGVAVAALGRWF